MAHDEPWRYLVAHGPAVRVTDEGQLLLSIEQSQGRVIEGFLPQVAQYGDGSAVAGRLPPRAVSAEVLDPGGDWHQAITAGGAWLAVLSSPFIMYPPVARFGGPRGGRVRVPRPEDAEVVRLDDVGRDCPACGEADWEQLRFPDRSWEWDPRFALWHCGARCRRCGHLELLGSEDRSTKRRRTPREPEREGADESVLMPFAPYALCDWDGQSYVSGSSLNGRLSSVAFTYVRDAARVSVHSAADGAPDDPERMARGLVGKPAYAGFRAEEEGVRGELRCRLDRRGADAEAAALRRRVSTTPVSLEVDGVQRDFVLATADAAWGLVPTAPLAAGVRVHLSGRGVEPRDVRLRRVGDPGRYDSIEAAVKRSRK